METETAYILAVIAGVKTAITHEWFHANPDAISSLPELGIMGVSSTVGTVSVAIGLVAGVGVLINYYVYGMED